MSGAERLNEVAQRLSPGHLAQVLQLAEHLAKQEASTHVSPGLAWLESLPEEDEELSPEEWESLRVSKEELAAGLPLVSLESLEAEFGLAP